MRGGIWRGLWRMCGFLALCLCFLAAALVLRCACFRLSAAARWRLMARLTQLWARALLRLLCIRVTFQGQRNQGPTPRLLVANHQSYLDILICAAYFPAVFVAKHELRRWPLLGWLAGLGGTLFIDRGCARSAVRCAFRASRVLRAGTCVQVFPEGTTTAGMTVEAFKPLFFAAARRARVAIHPLSIAVLQVDDMPAGQSARTMFCWTGEADFAAHFWRLLGIRAMSVALIAHEPLAYTPDFSARALAQLAQARVLAGLDRARLPVEAGRAAEQMGAHKNQAPPGLRPIVNSEEATALMG
ncbi:MAG: lysophospholipid acyltransferase family protein [Blastocatellia bacterium]